MYAYYIDLRTGQWKRCHLDPVIKSWA